ncbi:MAG: hypothetical protein ACREIC_13815 [Limisphaerales bacterium]
MNRILIAVAIGCGIAPLGRAEKAWTLKTADTSITVTANGSELTVTSLASTTGEANWIKDPAPLSLPDHVFLDNASRPVRWKFIATKTSSAAGETTLRFA